MTRAEIEQRVEDPDTRMRLQHSSPREVFRHALAQGWIKLYEFHAQRTLYGPRWHYTGD